MCTFEVFSNAEGGDVRNILFRVLNPSPIRVSSTSTTLSRRASFLSREEELRHKTFASLLRRKKREEKRSQHLYLSLVVDLSLTRVSGRRVCVCLSVVSEKEKERKREIFDPQTTKAIIHKKNEYIKNNDDDKRAPMPAKRRRGCKQQTSKREQRQMQQQ